MTSEETQENMKRIIRQALGEAEDMGLAQIDDLYGLAGVILEVLSDNEHRDTVLAYAQELEV